jgi:type III restriction enzyme
MVSEMSSSSLTLSQEIDAASKFHPLPNIPDYIPDNLAKHIKLRPYQEEAIRRFLFVGDNNPHLLFHMATGSGKTVIMASLILELYAKGFRNFIFFVNSTTIVNKTKDNFLSPQSNKYLYNDRIIIANKVVEIKEVNSFDQSCSDSINIHFSTIHGLHSALKENKENDTTTESLEGTKIALLSDEAHHINASTKTQTTLSEKPSWENTVRKLFSLNSENVLLEFTATADLKNKNILKKYKDLLIYDYDLKQFSSDGYSKSIKTIEFDSNDLFQRALGALILSQFRLKMYEDNNIPNKKPVVMFKSNLVNRGKNTKSVDVVSSEFQESFFSRLDKLTINDFDPFAASPLYSESLNYLSSDGRTLEGLISELKIHFSKERTICVNTDAEAEDLQREINNLEVNHYRAVFAVDKLNEGWDVLNLYDIVRLYNTTPGKTQKPGKTTMQEAQLIGRGARYDPFVYPDKVDQMRKFDDETTNELRICETMYYHCQKNPKYIEELRTAMRIIGAEETKSVERKIILKPEFLQSQVYKTGQIYLNEKKTLQKSKILKLNERLRTGSHTFTLEERNVSSTNLLAINNNNTQSKKSHFVEFKDIPDRIIRSAIDLNSFYRFDNLKTILPNLSSLSEFITSQNYLGHIKIEFLATDARYLSLDHVDKQKAVQKILATIKPHLERGKAKFRGSKEFKPKYIKDVFRKEITMNLQIKGEVGRGVAQSSLHSHPHLFCDLAAQNWYAYNEDYGTDQEKYLVKFIESNVGKLTSPANEVFLVRNEGDFGIYSFDSGERFEPDYVLFIHDISKNSTHVKQVFIEPKGEQIWDKDSWKNEFLSSIEAESRIQKRIDNYIYTLIGMPFYNKSKGQTEFVSEFSKLP